MTGSTTLPFRCLHTSVRFRTKNLVHVPSQAERNKTNSTPLISRYKPGLPQGQGKRAPSCNPARVRACQSRLLQIHCSSSHNFSSGTCRDFPAGPGHASVQVSLHVLQRDESMLTLLLCKTPTFFFCELTLVPCIPATRDRYSMLLFCDSMSELNKSRAGFS